MSSRVEICAVLPPPSWTAWPPPRTLGLNPGGLNRVNVGFVVLLVHLSISRRSLKQARAAATTWGPLPLKSLRKIL